jgi:glycogen(starch) synthase
VVGVYSANYPAPDFEVDRGVDVVRLRWPRRHFAGVERRYRVFRLITEWVRTQSLDLVEVPDYQGWAAGWPSLDVPVVTRLNGSASYFSAEMNRRVDAVTFRLERASLRRADFWCSASRYTADRTRGLFNLKTPIRAIVHNGVSDTVPVSRPSEREPRSVNDVVFSGTLTEKKGVYSLIAAWPSVVARYPGAQLHMFGKDSLSADRVSVKEKLLSALPTGCPVHFRGHVAREELLSALRTAAVAIFPSYAEAFALAPMEAMATGCPTIYSKRGSGPELIHHGRDGWLIDPDDVDEIADTLVLALRDRATAEQIGHAGRETIAQRFSSKVLLQRNVEFYQQCISTFQSKQVRREVWW